MLILWIEGALISTKILPNPWFGKSSRRNKRVPNPPENLIAFEVFEIKVDLNFVITFSISFGKGG